MAAAAQRQHNGVQDTKTASARRVSHTVARGPSAHAHLREREVG
jgi:hypothetical protein